MASPTLITPKPTTTTTTRLKSLLPQIKSKLTLPTTTIPTSTPDIRRRDLCSTAILFLSSTTATPLPALAAEDDEYVRETEDVINKVRTALTMDRTDPNVASAVAELRQVSNSWVAKYRREKSLLGRVSFRDMYSALNAVSGHYISFGPTAPIPTKRKARILEEMETAEKALQRGR